MTPLAWTRYKNFKREVRRELRFAEQEYAETHNSMATDQRYARELH